MQSDLTLTERFALLIEGLCRVVAARARLTPYTTSDFVLLWGRLRRLAARFARFVDRVPAKPRPPARPSTRIRPHRERPVDRFPRFFGAVMVFVPGAAVYGSQLQHLLGDPEMAVLLERPEVGRILRPLCRMLGIVPPAAIASPPKAAPHTPVASSAVPTMADPPMRAGGQGTTRPAGVLSSAGPADPPPGWFSPIAI